MTICATYWAWEKKGLTPLQKLVLISIADRPEGGDDVSLCKFSIESVSEFCNFAHRDVSDVVNDLISRNFLRIVEKSKSDNKRELLLCKLNIEDLPKDTW